MRSRISLILPAPGLGALLLLCVAVAAGGLVLPCAASAQAGSTLEPSAPAGPTPELRALIDALDAEKRARTPAERKLASSLLYAERRARGRPFPPGLAGLRSGVEAGSDGRVLLDIEAELTPGLLVRLAALGGEPVSGHPGRGALRARLPLGKALALAARGEVRRIAPAERAFTRKTDSSEGDGAHYADLARSGLGLDGSGVRVGVISDGVDALAALQASGDLPAVTVLPGQAGMGSEGTAMLEIVHDLAPGASLLFATGFGGQARFASNVVALRDAGADVIVDDVGYFAEAVFQDDAIAAAVDQMVADGALYFSAAGNAGNLGDGTAGVYEADFVAGPGFSGGPAHDFGGAGIGTAILVDSPFGYTLQWNDPLGASGNDYDLYLTDASGTQVVAFSNDFQDGDDDPFELVNSQGDDSGRRLVVVKSAGADRHLHLNAHRGRLEHATAGQIWGHAAARGAVAVAAVDARQRAAGFQGDEPVQGYSSDGPRRVFFEADGTALTPGDFSASGGELREVPDLAGADCVDTATPGFDRFCGTSAAAPHLAALAALLLEDGGGPGAADPDHVLDALAATALDIEAAGPDRDSGAGIARALEAAEALCAVDADCDDGLFCNGDEACVEGLCQAGAAPECSGLTTVCNETLDLCAICLFAADCDDGVHCNGTERCFLGACQPGVPPSCEGATPFCHEGADACSECLAAPDCDDGLYCTGAESCVEGACAPGVPPDCQAPTPFCDEGGDACAECLGDADCDDGVYCSGVESCEAGVCQPDTGPVCAAPTPACDEAQTSCVECLSHADCPQPSGGCAAGVCLDPAEVPLLPGPLGPLGGAALALALLGVGASRAGRRPDPDARPSR